jgi:hypothetical protein
MTTVEISRLLAAGDAAGARALLLDLGRLMQRLGEPPTSEADDKDVARQRVAALLADLEAVQATGRDDALEELLALVRSNLAQLEGGGWRMLFQLLMTTPGLRPAATRWAIERGRDVPWLELVASASVEPLASRLGRPPTRPVCFLGVGRRGGITVGGSPGGTIVVWDHDSGRELRRIELPFDLIAADVPVERVAVASAAPVKVTELDPETGQRVIYTPEPATGAHARVVELWYAGAELWIEVVNPWSFVPRRTLRADRAARRLVPGNPPGNWPRSTVGEVEVWVDELEAPTEGRLPSNPRSLCVREVKVTATDANGTFAAGRGRLREWWHDRPLMAAAAAGKRCVIGDDRGRVLFFRLRRSGCLRLAAVP